MIRPCIIFLAGVWVCASDAAHWPQVGGNPQHTNFTPDSPAPPYKVAWVADFSPEQIYSAQAVIAEGRVFQTTLNGSLYALDAADGRLLWRYDAGEPISGSPCLADGTLFIGTRRGTMLALGLDGAPKWKQPLSWHIFSTAAWDAGKLFVVTEDMFVHCLDAKSGEPLWRSEKLRGLTLREFHPVVHKGRVFVSVTPAEWPGGLTVKPFVWDPSPAVMDKYSTPIDPKQTGPNAPRRSLRGVAFDFVGYQNYHCCYCPATEKLFQAWHNAHAQLPPHKAREEFSLERLVWYYEQLGDFLRSLRPGLRLTAHVYPTFLPEPLYGNRLKLDYSIQTAAWFFEPYWPEAKVRQYARAITAEGAKYDANARRIPFVGLYVQRPIGDKPVERFAKELEWIFGAAGGTSLSIYDFGALVSHEGHRRALKEALARAASATGAASPQ